MARKIGIVTLLMLATCPAASWALGLGEIDLQSALNQPLQADIAIIGASADELGGLEVNLASPDAFRRLGLDRPAYLTALRFNVTRNKAGKPVLRISSRQPVTEPFVTFLIEAKWARGSLLREYTVLLDPPTFVPQASPAPPPPVPAPSTTRETQTSGTVLRQPPGPAAEPAPAPRPVATPPAGAPYEAPAGNHRAERGDTLWRIADRYRPAGITVNQMMIALYEANPEAFGGNINRLRAGSILRIPDGQQLAAVSPSDADFAVGEHMKSWRPGSGMVGERIAPKLQLVPPRDLGAGTGRGPVTRGGEGEETVLRQEVEQLQRQLDSAEDRIQVQDGQMAALQQQLAEARQRLAEVTGEPEASLSEPVTQRDEELVEEEPAADTLPIGAEGEVAAGEGEPEPEPVAEEAPTPTKVVTPAREESLLDQVMGWLFSPIAFIALGAIAVLAALLVFLRLRQRGQSEEEPWQQYDLDESVDDLFKDEPAESSTETLPTQAVARERESFLVHEQPASEDTASMDTGTFRGTATGAGLEAAAALLDEEEQALDRVPSIEESEEAQEESDPMAEADFHMAYGLYDQAADILRSALNRDRSNRELQMKLAEVFFVWGNQDEFKAMAEKLSGNRSDGDWDKILIMGKQLLPDDPLFSEMPGAGGGDVDLSLEATQVGGIVDMELGSGSFERSSGASAVDLDLGDALDFAGDTQETPAVEGEDGTQPGLEALDFDLGGESGGVESDLARTVETPRSEEFDIGRDFGDETPSTPTERTAEIDLDDLGLDVNLDDSFIGRVSADSRDDTEATGVRAAPDFGEDADDDTAATGMHAAGIIGDDEETMLARFDGSDGSATAVLERGAGRGGESTDVDFDIGGDFESTDLGNDATRELTDTETLNAGDIPAGLQETAEMTGIHRAGELDSTAEVQALAEDELDLDLGDLSDVLDEGETQEMPAGVGDTMEVLGVGEMDDDELDLDIGESFEDESGGTNTMEMTDMTMPEAEALTLSEIGTKLDLARAYMDMGDPDGARSILQEVMEEGDSAQQADAKRLLDTLP